MSDVRNGDTVNTGTFEQPPPMTDASASAPTPGEPPAVKASSAKSEPVSPTAAREPAAGGEDGNADGGESVARRRVRRSARTEADAAAAGASDAPLPGDAPVEGERGPSRRTASGEAGSDERRAAGAEGPDGGEGRPRRPRNRRRTGASGEAAPGDGPRARPPIEGGRPRPGELRTGADRPRPDRPRLDRPRGPERPDRGRPRIDGRPDEGPRGDRPRRPFDRGVGGTEPRRDGPRRPIGLRPGSGPGRPGDSMGGAPGARPPMRGAERRPEHGPMPTTAVAARPVVAVKSAAAPQKNSEDKVTLILHPAPKASPGRFKRTERPMTAKEALRAKAAKRVAQKSGKPATVSGPLASDEQREPVQELQPSWVEAAGTDALSIVGEAGTQAERLVLAWQDRGNVDALVALAAGDGASPSRELAGALRKAARRAINVLRSRGVVIPELAERAPAAGSVATDGASDAPTATFVTPDGTGTMFFSVTQRQSGGRYRVADAVIRDVVGIVHSSSGRLPGKQLRRWRERVEARVGAAPVDVPVEWAKWRIAEARRQNAISKQILPLGLDGCAPLFEPAPTQEPRHPIADLEAGISEADATAAIADSGKLHNEPELRSWMADRAAVDEMLRHVGAKVGAESAADQERVNSALDEEIAAATDRYFTPEARVVLSGRLRDAAISVRARAGDDAARTLLAVAKAVREAGLITAPPRDIPLLAGFFRKAIGVLASQDSGRLRIPVPGGAAGAAPRADVAAAPTDGASSMEPTGPLDEPDEESEGTDAQPEQG